MNSRKEKLETLTYDEGLKILYEWVKTGVIDFKEYKELIAVVVIKHVLHGKIRG